MTTNMKRKRRFAEGGNVDQEALDKEAGLAESNKEKPVGFFERMRMGNIDDPKSEAYKRFGAGRGAASRAAKVPVEDAVPKKVSQIKVESESMRGGPEEEKAPSGMGAATKFASKAPVAETKITAVTAKPEVKTESMASKATEKAPAARAPASKAPEVQAKEAVSSGRSAGIGGPTADELEKYAKSKRMDKAFQPPTDAEIEAGMDAAAAMLPAGASLRAIKALAEKMAAGKVAKLNKITRADIKPDASNRLGYTKPKSQAPYLKELGNAPLKVGMKKGGKVKTYASGGSVSASRRGDGIATKGKTRGKIC